MNSRLAKDKEFANKIIDMLNPSLKIGMLHRNRTVGFIVEENHINYLRLTDPAYKALKMHSIRLNHEPLYIGFSKQSITYPAFLEIREKWQSGSDDIRLQFGKYGIE